MPQYYFDVTDAGGFHRDEFGDECDDDEDAKDQAIRILHTITPEWSPDNDQHEFVAIVRDEKGAVVYEVSLALSGRWGPGRK